MNSPSFAWSIAHDKKEKILNQVRDYLQSSFTKVLLKLKCTPLSVTVFDIFLLITLQVVIIFILVVIAFLLVYLLYLFIDSKRKPVELSITADEVIILTFLTTF